MKPMPVRTELCDRVAIITIDNPPVNCLDRATRTALLRALEESEHDPTTTAVVVTGVRNFSAGADLKEFDSGEGLAEPTLHLAITGFLDRMTKPVVAAIDGAALGGGLELALACHARVATGNAIFGLPETTLGFMPGAGGTQRLPRAVGLERATSLILTGRTISPPEAIEIGLVSASATDDLIGLAILTANELSSGTALPRLRDVSIDEPLAEGYLAFVRRGMEKQPRTTMGQRTAIDALVAAVTLPFDRGLATELHLFEGLLASSEAAAARYRFLAERQAGRVTGAPRPVPVNAVGIVGGGTMGRGIALAFLASGLPVCLIETTTDRADAARAGIEKELERGHSRGRISNEERLARQSRLSVSTNLSDVSEADLVVEAVFEDLAAKREVFRALDGVTGPKTILASNTSSLDVDSIGEATKRPGQVVGLHFFSPANVMPLVEVVNGKNTSPGTLSTAVTVVSRLGKTPVIAEVGDGFIGNRIMDQYVRQAMQLLRLGLTPSLIDGALERWGMAMGPFRVLDLVGNDIPWHARVARGGTPGPEWAIADSLCERGWFGQKTGRGWYDYPARDRAEPNPDLAELLPRHAESGPTLTDDDVVGRCVLAMVNEGSAVVRDGTSARASDVDIVMVKGYGFPADRGGPLYFADRVGLDRVLEQLDRFAASSLDDPFWKPDPLLVELAAMGATFAKGARP